MLKNIGYGLYVFTLFLGSLAQILTYLKYPPPDFAKSLWGENPTTISYSWAIIIFTLPIALSPIIAKVYNKYFGKDLFIHAANWGCGDKSYDVTKALRSRKSSFWVTATNDIGGDPAYGEKKSLKVTYSINGKKYDKTVDEGETLILP